MLCGTEPHPEHFRAKGRILSYLSIRNLIDSHLMDNFTNEGKIFLNPSLRNIGFKNTS